jgi:murein DD-endopeptidase MepM/ murein hydrolase activator NlpD
MRYAAALALTASLLPACAAGTPEQRPAHAAVTAAAGVALPKIAPPRGTSGTAHLPSSAPQGALVIGRAPPGSTVSYRDRSVRVSPDGRFVIGIPRDASGEQRVRIVRPSGAPLLLALTVLPRDWPVERVNGVPPSTVKPSPAIAARIAAEQARVSQARLRDEARVDFLQAFAWPVQGRVSGRFGNQRIYNGSPGAAHSGTDIAAPTGTAVRAPAAGVVSFADPALYLTGGTLVLDHGHGVSSNFLHLSRLDVRVGDRIAQGQALGAVGATGRATGPHLHWGMNWFDVRVDPLLVLERGNPAD